MSGPRFLWLLALCVAALTVGAAPAAADPYDAQVSNRAFSASFIPTLPFALGEVDLTTLGVPDSAFATVGPSATAWSSGDGPNMYIVDDNLSSARMRRIRRFRRPSTRRAQVTGSGSARGYIWNRWSSDLATMA